MGRTENRGEMLSASMQSGVFLVSAGEPSGQHEKNINDEKLV
jgi:hypothetical protein